MPPFYLNQKEALAIKLFLQNNEEGVSINKYYIMSTKDKKNKVENHTRLFNKVMAIPKKKMSQAEKVMFSYIISYCLQDDIFTCDNDFISKVLGDKPQSITDYITRLQAMALIRVEYKRSVGRDGNYHGTKRYITVNDLGGWTEMDTSTPEVLLIPKKNSKKKPAVDTVPSTEENIKQTDTQAVSVDAVKPAEPAIDTLTVPPVSETVFAVPEAQPLITKGIKVPKSKSKTKPSTKPKTAKAEPSLEDMLKEAEFKAIEVSASTQIQQSDGEDKTLTLDFEKDFDTSSGLGRIIIGLIKKNDGQIKFIPVNVKIGDDFVPDEATLLPNGSNKYYSKSTLKLLEPNLFAKASD